MIYFISVTEPMTVAQIAATIDLYLPAKRVYEIVDRDTDE